DSVVRYALRNASVSMRDILVRTATEISGSSEHLKDLVLSNTPIANYIKDPNEIGNLGRLALLQNLLSDDKEYGVKLLDTACKLASSGEFSLKNKLVLAQQYILDGNTD